MTRAALRALAQGALAVVALGVAAWLATRSLRGLRASDIASALSTTAGWRLAACAALTATSFACLARYECIATDWVAPGRLPRVEAWRTGLIAHALANTLGFHAFVAGAVRWRAYSRHGLGVAEVARIVAAVAACVAAGAAAIASLAWITWSATAGPRTGVVAVALAAGIATLVVLYAWWRRRHGPADQRSRGSQALAVGATGLLEMGASIGALYVLLPVGAAAPAGFVLVFLGAAVLGLASHVPGGLGVFEAGVLAGLPAVPVATLLAALLVYRLVYNLAPCALALVALASRTRATAG